LWPLKTNGIRTPRDQEANKPASGDSVPSFTYDVDATVAKSQLAVGGSVGE